MALRIEVDSHDRPVSESDALSRSGARGRLPAGVDPRDTNDPVALAAVDAAPAIAAPRRALVPILVESSPSQALPTSPPFDLAPPRRLRRPTVSVIIPTLNEAKNLPYVLPNIPDDIHEVILVDGRSTDGTAEVALSLRPTVRVVVETKPGKGAALRAGFLAATGDIIVMLDADGSADPREIPRFVDALVAGADFAKGSRFVAGGGSADITRLRSLGNIGFTWLVRLLFGGRYSDLCYGYNAFWSSVVPLREIDVPGFEVETLLNITALRHGLKITEVASYEHKRIHGVSNLRAFPDGWSVLCTIVRERLSPRVAKYREAAPAADRVGRERELVPVMMDSAAMSGARDEA